MATRYVERLALSLQAPWDITSGIRAALYRVSAVDFSGEAAEHVWQEYDRWGCTCQRKRCPHVPAAQAFREDEASEYGTVTVEVSE